MEDERLHLCTHLGVLGPAGPDARRRCLRCGAVVAAELTVGSRVEPQESAVLAETAEFEAWFDEPNTGLDRPRQVRGLG